MASRSSTRSRPTPEVGKGPGRALRLPLVHFEVPLPESELPYYAVLGALAAFEVVEWPVALIVGAGHLLARRARHESTQEAAQAAEAA